MTEFAVLCNFLDTASKGGTDRADAALKGVAKALTGAGEKGSLQFQLLSEKGTRHACLRLASKACTVAFEQEEKPDVELIVQEQTALEMLGGSLSPLEALLRGRMRFRGDAKLALRLLHLLASSSTARFHICATGA